MTKPETLWLGGREYRYSTRTTVRQDIWNMSHARHAGLAGAVKAEDESPEEFMARLMDNLTSSGRALLLMGGMLEPVGGAKWTEEIAGQTALHLGDIADDEGKKALYIEMASCLLGFFANGLASWIGSQSASVKADKNQTASESSPSESGRGSSE